jgi:hypothetical protein
MFGTMEFTIKEIFGLIRDKAKVCSCTQINLGMKDIGETIKNKEKEFYFKIKKQYKLVTLLESFIFF